VASGIFVPTRPAPHTLFSYPSLWMEYPLYITHSCQSLLALHSCMHKIPLTVCRYCLIIVAEAKFEAGMVMALRRLWDFFYYFIASLSFYLNGDGDEINGVILNIIFNGWLGWMAQHGVVYRWQECWVLRLKNDERSQQR